jgi:hypothetical protein
MPPRLKKHCNSNHTVNTIMKEWGSLKRPFPALAPITEIVKIKHAAHDAFTRKMITATGDWADKTELFLWEFEGIVPAASVQGKMAVLDLQDPNLHAFVFSDMEMLDANQPCCQEDTSTHSKFHSRLPETEQGSHASHCFELWDSFGVRSRVHGDRRRLTSEQRREQD